MDASRHPARRTTLRVSCAEPERFVSDPASNSNYIELAEALLDRRDPGALEFLHLAEACGADPDRCAAGRWLTHMLAGDFASAWLESDAICLRGAPDPNRMWNGESLQNRRVIVRCLHGLGDTIQFLRYAPRLRNLA